MTLSEREVRMSKREQIKNFGIFPYAQKFDKKTQIGALIEKYGAELTSDSSPFRDIDQIISLSDKSIFTAGRLMLFRSHGKLSFGKLMDETGEIQLMFHRDNCGIISADEIVLKNLGEGEQEISAYKFIEKFVDVGDFLGVKGELFYTHKGELTIFVEEFKLLSKAIQPLGDKFHGIAGQETAYRQRYLDMIFNRPVLERMKLRSKFLKVIRDFYDQKGFIELETPVLGNSASGAAAAPFVTHHNDFDLDMYLRISPETSLKKATVGMLEKVFEVAKDFRNEGSDPSHIQEFTMIEHYAAYRNHEDNMQFTEEMFEYIFAQIPQLSKTVSVVDKEGTVRQVDFQTPWQRIDYVQQIKKDSGIDVSLYSSADEQKLRADILEAGHHRVGIEQQGTATMIDYLYKKVTRPQIIGPAFIVNYPKTMQPLARVSDQNSQIVEQRQLLINGRECIKAYSELVDPVQQQANFDEQAKAVAQGDEEATKGDDDFVKAMEYGMPCQSGRGMGIDRIFALLLSDGQPINIRDVVLFPLMKPEVKYTRDEENGEE
ncbi:MAG TPA: lysine--tRNA ligase [Candidatus Absconditabacterales bacterium]|nr:lysine--tRNA ligase [Candidatus Absconditabacterales bacterium]